MEEHCRLVETEGGVSFSEKVSSTFTVEVQKVEKVLSFSFFCEGNDLRPEMV